MRIFIIFLISSLMISGVWIFKKLPNLKLIDRYLIAAIPAVSFLVVASVLVEVLYAPFFYWNAIRLAPTFALTHGYQLYYGADTGPILSTIYGCITALAYLPATLASSPTGAVIIGSLISTAFFFIPVLLLLFYENFLKLQAVPNLNNYQILLRIIYSLYAFIGFFFYAYSSSSLNKSAFMVHADAIALGLGATACIFLYCREHKDSLFPLLLSAIVVVLAIWTKQTALPLVVALPTYVLLADGRRRFKLYLLCIFITGLIISALLLTIFNPQYAFFNMFVIPGNHPWRVPGTLSDIEAIALVANGREVPGDQVLALLVASKELIKSCLVPGLIIFWGVLYQLLFLRSTSKKITGWFSDNRWSMLLIVSLFMIPTSLLGRVKVGGEVNSFSFTLYFLAAAATLFVFRLILDSVSGDPASSKSFTPLEFLTLVLFTAFFLNYTPTYALRHLNTRFQELPSNPLQVEYDYARLHPGEVYFPQNPLPSLMAEGKLYHFEYALMDRMLAGYPVSNKNFRSYIPSEINEIAFSKLNNEYILNLLPEFSRQVEVNELPGWAVYVRE